jgi:uncharacterized protein (TIGR04141 family)
MTVTKAGRVPRPRNGPGTRQKTLHRIVDGADLARAEECLTERARSLEVRLERLELAGAPAVLAHAREQAQIPDWCADLRLTTGVQLGYETVRAGAVLFVVVDGVLYAVTYGAGSSWLDDAVKDRSFGLAVVIRCVDPNEIVDAVRRRPGARGRTDATLVPRGTPVWLLGINRYAELVRKLGGRTTDVQLTHSRLGSRSVTVEGSAGIRMPFGLEPAHLVADIRAIAEVLSTQPARPDLAFVENIVPVTVQATLEELDRCLDTLLAGRGEARQSLSLAVPIAALDEFRRARLFQVRVGGLLSNPVEQVALEDILRRARWQPDGRRVERLRAGRVEMFASSDGSDPLGSTRALSWIEAQVSLGARRFVLVEGEWFELGATYLAQLRQDVERLLSRGSGSVGLPAWRRTADGYGEEKDYNDRVATGDPRYLRMDRRLVQTLPGRSSGIEICDLLGPDDELIHVKKASGSAPLSHLFAQALVSAEALFQQAEVRAEFGRLVAAHGHGRTVPGDFVPKKIIFGILLKDGEELTVDTLFPFAQVALCQTVLALEGRGVVVEVVGIRAEPR